MDHEVGTGHKAGILVGKVEQSWAEMKNLNRGLGVGRRQRSEVLCVRGIICV